MRHPPRRPRARPSNLVLVLLTAAIGGWSCWLAFMLFAEHAGSIVQVALGLAIITFFLALFHTGALMLRELRQPRSRH